MSKSSRINALGIIIILFYVYRFFLIKRLPYEINDKVSWTIFLIVIIILFTQIFMAIKIIQELRKQNIQTPLWVAKILELSFYTPLKQIRELLLKLTVIKNLAKDWSVVIEFSLRSAATLYGITIALFIIPRLLLAICLFCDVFLFHKIYCFYQLLWIIIIPISIQIMLAFAKQHTSTNRENLELVLETTAIGNTFTLTAATPQITEEAFHYKTYLWTYFE